MIIPQANPVGAQHRLRVSLVPQPRAAGDDETMTLAAAKTKTYDPRAHLADSYPTWCVTTADLGGHTHEIVAPRAKLIIIDPAAFGGDDDWAFAHAASHLDEHAGQLAHLTGDACDQADYLALLWLDRPGDRSNL